MPAAVPSQQIRIPFFDPADVRPGQEGLLTKDQFYLNSYIEAVQMGQDVNYHLVKRPGVSSFLTVGPTGPGRGCIRWKQNSKLYSVNNNKILSNTTDLGVTLRTSAGFVNFEETRPGATTQYLGVNDGDALYLIASDDSVIVLNNVPITSSSVANPTTITAPSHGLNSGNKIIIRNHTGSTPSINDTIFVITKTGTNTFTIPVNVTVGGTGGTIGVFPAPNTSDLKYMDGYWFTMKVDGSIWNCSVDDPTTWPVTSFINAQMLPGRGVGLAKQANTLAAFTDRHFQMFYDAANPVGSPLSNIEEAMHRLGCISSNSIASQEDTIYWVTNTPAGGFTVYKLDGTSNLEDIGTPTVNRSLVSNFFLTPGSPSSKQIILTNGTVWTVPADFNNTNNKIEAIGGGHDGLPGSGTTGGAGGGGGAYATLNNFNTLGAPTIPFVIGNGSNGSDTTFNVTSVVAKGANGTGGKQGGQAASCTPTTGAMSGGDGGNGTNGAPFGDNGAGGGGGGAAGASGNGIVGSDGSTWFDLGGHTHSQGGNGGQGDGSVGGIGGTGAGLTAGTAGGAGTEWTTAGSGGGGGGAGANQFGATRNGLNGGNYGAGGGGASGTSSTQGNGINGVIVITYVPSTTATDQNAANGYILRIAGHTFYILNLVNNKETWVYDQSFKVWFKWQSPTNDVWPVVNAVQHTPFNQPSIVVGQDPTTGTIWQISTLNGQDNGVNFEVRAQTIPLTFGSMKRKFYTVVELIGDKQTSSTPVLVSYSDDDYVSFSSPRTLDMTNTRTFQKSWGNSRKRAWRISYTGANPLRMYGIEFTYSSGEQ